MIPLRDSIPSYNTPIATYCLLGLNFAIFCLQIWLMLQGQLDEFLETFAVIPAREVAAFGEVISGNALALPDLLIPVVFAMFLHGGFLHIIGNMLYLWVFADNVEDIMGHWRFVTFYLLCGFIATAAQVALDPTSEIPNLGASGAIAGVLGAYLVNFPRAKVQTIFPYGIFIFLPLKIPALFYLGWWFFQQTLYGVASLGVASDMGTGGVAFFAHVGGFVAGLVLVKIFVTRDNPQALY